MARSFRQGPSTWEFKLNSRSGSFAADVDKIVVNTEKRMNLVMKQALINTVNDMQTPVSKGGRMRVDTGFLRASGQASLNGMPSGPSVKPKDASPGQYGWQAQQTEVLLGEMKFGATFYFGWTANYAKYREAYDGFMITAIQNWQQTVDKIVEEAKRRFK